MRVSIAMLLALGLIASDASMDGQAGGVNQQLTVDATGPIRERVREPIILGSGMNDRKLPLKIELDIPAQQPHPQAGERLFIDFVLTNTGVATIKFPVSPHPADLESQGPHSEYTLEHLILSVTLDAKVNVTLIGGGNLYGNGRVQGTLFDLAPRESIRVRTEVMMQANNGPAIEVEGKRRLVGYAILNRETLKLISEKLMEHDEEIGSSISKPYEIEVLPK